MGSPGDSSPPAKLSNSRPNPASIAPSVPEATPMPTYTADWTASMQAYYSSGPPAPTAFFPPVWGGQHLIAPYGTPIGYPPLYPHGAVFAHPFMAPVQGMSFPTAETGNMKGDPKMSGDGGKASSGSGEENTSQRSRCGSATDGSSDTRDDSSDPQESPKKRSYKDAFQEGEASQLAMASRGQASKLPVSAPGITMPPSPATNLNIGMDIWNAPHTGSASLDVRPMTGIAPPVAGANGVFVDRRWAQTEREMKRERRKQSNRESARRSRMRKMQECDELAKNVAELNDENNALKMELEQLHKVCKDLEAENQHIVEELHNLHRDSSYISRENASGGGGGGSGGGGGGGGGGGTGSNGHFPQTLRTGLTKMNGGSSDSTYR